MPFNIPVIENPEYWRQRAKEARTRSERVGDSITKALILETADSYERMAKACEEQPSTFPHEQTQAISWPFASRTTNAAPISSIDQGGGKRRSDFVSVNLENGLAAIPKIVRRILNYAHLGAHLFASKSSGNGVSDFRQLALHNMTVRTAILAMHMQRIKRSHLPSSDQIARRFQVKRVCS
jgi:hypothetical protein